MAAGSPRLVVFAGLPGCGKTTLARAVADELGATFLRIDTFEAAIVSTLTPFEDNPVGYVAAAWVAEDQLRGGRTVVVDACNNVREARKLWTDLALGSNVRLRWIEVICSDAVEHRRRVETRKPDRPGQGNPTWAQVRTRTWEPFAEPRILIDNTGAVAEHVATIRAALRNG